MKISWGTAIVIAIVGFMIFILYLVITMTTNEKLDHDLVVEEYYKQELGFQDQLDKELNSQSLSKNIKVEQTAEGLLVHFPEDLDLENIEGKVFLYRTSNKQLDFEMPISLSSHQLLVPDHRLVVGRWNIRVDWTYKSEAYFFQQELTY